MAQKPKILEKRIALELRKILVVEEDLQFPDGHLETWEYVELKGGGGSKVLAITENQELILVREYRGAAAKYVLRIPTGTIEEGELPEDAAKRELAEETGFQARNIEFIEQQLPSSSFFKSTAYLYLATDLQATEMHRDPSERDMEVIKIPLSQVYQMVEDLEINEPQTIYAILRLKKYLKQKSQ